MTTAFALKPRFPADAPPVTLCGFMVLRFLIAIVVFSVCIGRTVAQAPTSVVFDAVPNYSYAVFVGSGIYRLDDRKIFIARMRFSRTWTEPDAESGSPGIRFLLPVTVGITNFEDFDDIPNLVVDDLATLSFVPGVEFEYVVRPNLSIKPFAQAGFGWELQDGDLNFVWGAGMRARMTLPRKKSAWVLGGELLVAGNVPGDDEPSTDFTRMGLGLEYKFPIRWTMLGRQSSLHAQVIGYHYFNEAEFKSPRRDIMLDDIIQIGLSIGIDPAAKFLGIPVRQLGLGYKYGSDVSAIILITSFPF